jgi:hypothetical protein
VTMKKGFMVLVPEPTTEQRMKIEVMVNMMAELQGSLNDPLSWNDLSWYRQLLFIRFEVITQKKNVSVL